MTYSWRSIQYRRKWMTNLLQVLEQEVSQEANLVALQEFWDLAMTQGSGQLLAGTSVRRVRMLEKSLLKPKNQWKTLKALPLTKVWKNLKYRKFKSMITKTKLRKRKMGRVMDSNRYKVSSKWLGWKVVPRTQLIIRIRLYKKNSKGKWLSQISLILARNLRKLRTQSRLSQLMNKVLLKRNFT